MMAKTDKTNLGDESTFAAARRLFEKGLARPSELQETIVIKEFSPDDPSVQDSLAAMHRGTEMARQLVKSVEKIKRRARISLAENPSKHGPN